MAKKSNKTIGGQPATQKNVTLLDAKIEVIKKAGKLDYMSFSAYVTKLIDADLQQS